jgi:hypothetical protein
MSDQPAMHTTVADIQQRLDVLIDEARRANSRIAYFAVLYRLVTRALQETAAASPFEDPARIERLTAIFAARYFDALDRFMRKQAAPLCWSEAFRAATNMRPVVVQHLLLGMNAHINYDLGISCVQAAPGAELARLRPDFDLVNDVLAGLIDRVEQALARIYPALRLADALGGRTDEQFLAFSLRAARAAAWSNAERLALLEGDARSADLERMDRFTQSLARKVLTPGLKLTLVLLLVRAQERGSVASIADRLEAAPEVNAYLNQLSASVRAH